MKRSKERRRRLLVDWQVQGALCLRVAAYWVACQLTMVVTMIGMGLLHGGEVSQAAWNFIVPTVCISTIVLPIVLFDLAAFSNRFAGPMVCVRSALKSLSEQRTTGNVEFRPKDFYLDIADSLNDVRARMLEDKLECEECPTEGASDQKEVVSTAV